MRLVVIVHLSIDEGVMDETKDFYKHSPSKLYICQLQYEKVHLRFYVLKRRLNSLEVCLQASGYLIIEEGLPICKDS